MAVAVDEVIGVGHQVQPGDYVDVFVVLRRDSQEIADSQARMLLSRLRVLAYGAGAVNDARRAEGAEQMMSRREGAKTAVLSVPLEQVNKLVMAQQAGRLTLALRNPKDETMPSEGMFADPPGVLQARAGVPPEAARAPADKALGGVALAGLVGTAPVRHTALAAAPVAPPSIRRSRGAAGIERHPKRRGDDPRRQARHRITDPTACSPPRVTAPIQAPRRIYIEG